MLKSFAVALFAIAMSVGFAQAKGHKHMIPSCAEGKQATATCACGTAANGHPTLCQKGQWCHSSSYMPARSKSRTINTTKGRRFGGLFFISSH